MKIFNPETILIVDDEPAVAEAVMQALQQAWSAKYTTYYVVNRLADAITVVSGFSLDLIFLDLRLPDSADMETLDRTVEALRSTGQEVPIIVMSGFIIDDEGLECLKRGAHDYLLKGAQSNTKDILRMAGKVWAAWRGRQAFAAVTT